MRVLYFSPDYTTHDRRFLDRLARTRHEIWHLRADRGDLAYESRPAPDGVRTVDLPRPPAHLTGLDRWLHQMPAFEEALAQIQPDLVHAGPIQSTAYMAALAGHHPLLVASWAFDLLLDAERDDAMREATRYTLARADWLHVDSPAGREAAARYADVPADRTIEFPWGIQLDRGILTQRKPRRPGVGPITVISSRTWGPMYGIETVVEAFRLAHAREPRLRLTLIGDGPLAGKINRAIHEAGLDDVITRPGRLPEDELTRRYADADIYLSCTRTDGTSISLLEAMWTGLPPVVSDIAGNRAWIEPGRNGFLAPVDDASAFAEALLHAAHLPDSDVARMAAENRRLVETRADFGRNVEKLVEAYERIERSLSRR